jgi:hypothetical protein
MASKNGWKVDLSGWTTMKAIREWQTANRAMDIDEINRIMAEVITSWPLAGDPSKLESYDDLSPQDWKTAAQEVSRVAGDIFRD